MFSRSAVQPSEVAVRPLRVLLVDDSPDFLQSAVRFFYSEPNVQLVGCALSGSDALQQVGRLKPDLVLMDLAMPGMNGLEAALHLKGEQNPPRIVILTLHDTPEYRAVAKVVGADGFVAKSEFGTEIVPLIRNLFRRSQE